MKRERKICPTCGKKLCNDRALMHHLRDSHSRASAFEREKGGLRLWWLLLAAVAVGSLTYAAAAVDLLPAFFIGFIGEIAP